MRDPDSRRLVCSRRRERSLRRKLAPTGAAQRKDFAKISRAGRRAVARTHRARQSSRVSTRTILVVDDEPRIRRVVSDALADGETRTIEAATGREAVDAARSERPDLIVLDLGLPVLQGIDVCRTVRAWTDAPILVLSARHSDAEKVLLLDNGADDYVTKPFSTVEFQARVRALLRRAPREEAEGRIVVGDLAIDLVAHTVSVAGSDIHLTPIEWQLLRALATKPDRTLTHRQLFAAAWPGRVHGDAQHYLRVYMTHLRRKLEREPARPRHIVTELGVGYRFVP
jgi:two-component system KDP operon response regulator KdpE